MGRKIESIKLSGISKIYRNNSAVKKAAIENLSVEFKSDQFTTIIGPNGCGKTTILNILAGIIPFDNGSINYSPVKPDKIKIGYIWQNYRDSLLPWTNVIENITFPLKLIGHSKEQRNEIVKNLFSTYSIKINPNSKIYELSGGEQQLVCLLRTKVFDPDILLLDEPFSALDRDKSWQMSLMLQQMWQEILIPTVLISHDIDQAILLGDKIIILNNNGRIIDEIINSLPRPRTLEMLESPEHINIRNIILKIEIKNE